MAWRSSSLPFGTFPGVCQDAYGVAFFLSLWEAVLGRRVELGLGGSGGEVGVQGVQGVLI